MAVIDLPPWAVPNGASPSFLDFGGVLRPSTGAGLLRVDRLGSRYKAKLSFPPFTDQAQGRIIVSRLIRAKRMGLAQLLDSLFPRIPPLAAWVGDLVIMAGGDDFDGIGIAVGGKIVGYHEDHLAEGVVNVVPTGPDPYIGAWRL